MSQFADRIRETTTTTGTGTISLDGASAANYRTFVAGIGTGKAAIYTIRHRNVTEWEVGLGVVTDATPDTLSRAIVLNSSNAGSLVDFTAGIKDVFVSVTEFHMRSLSQLPRRVRVATTINGTIGSAFANGQTVDGVTLATGDRILLKNQSTASQNGIYTVNASGSPTRAVDYYTGDGVAGTLVIVEQGTANADAVYLCTNNTGSAVVGTDNLAYIRLSGPRIAAIAELTPTDGNIIVGDGATWVAESGATARQSLGVVIGTDVQAYNAGLAAIAGLAVTDNNIIVGNGSTWVAESGSTARTSLGLGSTDSVQFGNIGIGIAPVAQEGFVSKSTLSGNTVQIGGNFSPTCSTGATAFFIGNYAQPKPVSGSYTIATCVVYYSDNPTALAGGAVITNLYGVLVKDQTRATNNFGAALEVTSGSNKWNLYASGTANNLMNGGLIFGQMASEPTPGSNQAAIYAYDVAGTAEIKVVDEAANRTQISPHPERIIESHDAMMNSVGLKPVLVPWGYESTQEIVGVQLTADLAAALRCIEYLMKQAGKPVQLIKERIIKAGKSWEERQAESEAAHRQQVADYQVAMAAIESEKAKWQSDVQDWEAYRDYYVSLPDKERDEMLPPGESPEQPTLPEPTKPADEFVSKPEPAWLAERRAMIDAELAKIEGAKA